MSNGIPARDVLVDRNGQITSIWLIFFERLYDVFSMAEQSSTESIVQIREIAESAQKLAQQTKTAYSDQQKQISELHKLITNSVGDYATSHDISVVNKQIEQTKYDIDQLQSALSSLQKSFKDVQKEVGEKTKSLQEQINKLSQTSLRDAPPDGRLYGRKDAEWTEVVAVKLSLPFFLSDGSSQALVLTTDYQLPFFLSDGTQQNIQMVTT